MLSLRKNQVAITCLSCGTILTSWDVHDFKTCGCENSAMIDGGGDYTRYGFKDRNKVVVVELKPLRLEGANDA